MNKRVIITGGTGLIGKKIIPILADKGYEIIIFTRNIDSAKNKFGNSKIDFVKWDYTVPIENIKKCLDGCEVIINLAGASIGDRRWNESYKKIIYDSRILTTKKIVEAISKCNEKPKTLLSSSAIGYYGTTGEETLTEGSPGSSDFMASLCKDWEAEAMNAEKYGVRVAIFRTGIVLDKEEGALKRFTLPFKLFTGGYQGKGNQWVSWIHIDDLINLFLFALENKNMESAINTTTQFPVTNKEFGKILGKVLKRPCYLPVPGFVLRLAIGEFSEYILKGRKVIPEKAIDNGFVFKFEKLDIALENLLK